MEADNNVVISNANEAKTDVNETLRAKATKSPKRTSTTEREITEHSVIKSF